MTAFKLIFCSLIFACSIKVHAQSYASLAKLTKETTKETYDNAEQQFAKAVSKSKKDAYVYFERHLFYLKFRQQTLALADIDKAISLMPDKYMFYEYRTDLLFEMDSLEKAYEDIELMYRMDASIPDVHTYKAQYYFMKDSLKLALQSFDKAISIYETNNAPCSVIHRSYRGRGNLNMAFGNIDASIVDFTKAIALSKDSRKDNIYILRARAYLLKDDERNAFQDIGMAMALKPDTLSLGFIYSLQDDEINLELLIQKMLPKILLMPEFRKGINLYNIACYYSIMNNKAKAIEFLEKSMQSGYVKFNWVQLDYDMRNIKELPEFAALCAKYGNVIKN